MREVLLASRRAALQHALPLLLAATPAMIPRSAIGFDNRLPPDEIELNYKTPRTPGPKPADIGPRAGNQLKPCIDGKPHCFSSSPEDRSDDELDTADYGETSEWLVKPFRFSKPLAEALADLKAAIGAYPPGQRGIDGGGFKLVTESATADGVYLYVQYEAQRKGYIDDMEWVLSNNVAQVRTSSRLGYLDMGVNAKRFNWFVERLGEAGWSTVPITSKVAPGYFELNGIKDADMRDTALGMVRKTEKIKM